MSRVVVVDIDSAVLEAEMNLESVLLHCTYKKDKFTKTDYKEFLSIWVQVLKEFKARGIQEVFSIVPKDKNICKWQSMFGLEPLLEFPDSYLYRRVLTWD